LLCRKGTELQCNVPKNRDYIPLSKNRDFEVYSIEKTGAPVPVSLPEPVFKTKECGKESTQ
jgi:hypothetical protein